MRFLGALAGLAALFLALPAQAEESDSPYYVMMAGFPRIIDGDTLDIQGERVRLHGIDAPEMDQPCLTASGAEYACGEVARDYLIALTFGRPIRCMVLDFDRYKRALSVCWLLDEDGERGLNINADLVGKGLALEYPHIPDGRPRYDGMERYAKAQRLGLWSGTFITPWDWRGDKRSYTIEEMNERLRNLGDPV